MSILKRQLDELVAYPPHEPRTESPTYVKTHKHLVYELDAPCWICGIRHSTGGKMETHHAHFEWASQNGLDLEKVTADWPDITDRAKLAIWIDSEGNMLVLCLPGDEPVLMADGTEKRLDGIERGDYVIGHDREPHRVTDTMSRRVDEEIVVVDGRRMTANHPVLTPDGWLPAGLLACGDLALHVGVLTSEMFALGGIQGQVLDPVVAGSTGAMVDNLSREQASSEMLLHDPDVLHDLPSLLAFPDAAANVAITTDDASLRDPFLGFDSFWCPVIHVERLSFHGRVYDISVAGCHSFVTSGLVVHNCAAHHRGKYTGIHEITYPAWLLQKYEGDDFTFISQETVPKAKVALFS